MRRALFLLIVLLNPLVAAACSACSEAIFLRRSGWWTRTIGPLWLLGAAEIVLFGVVQFVLRRPAAVRRWWIIPASLVLSFVPFVTMLPASWGLLAGIGLMMWGLGASICREPSRRTATVRALAVLVIALGLYWRGSPSRMTTDMILDETSRTIHSADPQIRTVEADTWAERELASRPDARERISQALEEVRHGENHLENRYYLGLLRLQRQNGGVDSTEAREACTQWVKKRGSRPLAGSFCAPYLSP